MQACARKSVEAEHRAQDLVRAARQECAAQHAVQAIHAFLRAADVIWVDWRRPKLGRERNLCAVMASPLIVARYRLHLLIHRC